VLSTKEIPVRLTAAQRLGQARPFEPQKSPRRVAKGNIARLPRVGLNVPLQPSFGEQHLGRRLPQLHGTGSRPTMALRIPGQPGRGGSRPGRIVIGPKK
jgi:hypothetical protein